VRDCHEIVVLSHLWLGWRLILEFHGCNQTHHQQNREDNVDQSANYISGKDLKRHIHQVEKDAKDIDWNVPAA
jgi:hypothetical protein